MNNSQTTNQKRLIKYKDIFIIGNHIVGFGDARDKEFVDRVIGKKKIKAVIVDPPYATQTVENKIGFSQIRVPRKILNDDIAIESKYTQFTKDFLTPILPHLTPKNSFYIFNGDPMIFALREGMRQTGVKFSQLLVWIKNNSVIGRKDYLLQHELVAYGWYGKHEFRKSKDKSVLWYPKPNKSPLHPTQKPVGLIRRFILNSTEIGDTVYDCFAGSGTLAVAAEQTKRSSILIELDREYCQTIIDRLEKLFNIKAEKIYEKR